MIRRLFRRGPDWYDEASAFVDGELAPAREAPFAQAMAASPQLQHYVAELQATKAALAALPQPDVPRPFTISVAQAQGSPAMTRRQPSDPIPTQPVWRGGPLFEGTLLLRGAATFSAVAIAALSAVVVVDVTQNDGDSQIFRESAAVSTRSEGADDQSETSVAAFEADQSADQAIEQAQTQAAPLARAQAQAAPLARAQAQAAPLARAQAQAAEEAEQATAAEGTTELEYADATSGAQAQALPNSGTVAEDTGTDDSPAAAASEQLAPDPADEPEEAVREQGDPAIAAAADPDDAVEEQAITEALVDEAVAEPADAALEDEATGDESPVVPAAALPADETADTDSEADGPPIEQGTGSGQAEQEDLRRAADQVEDSGPPTRTPADETVNTDSEADGPPIEQGTGSGQAEQEDLRRAADQVEDSAPPTRAPADETVNTDSEADGPPIAQGTGSGQAEQEDLRRAADQIEDSAPPTRAPADETASDQSANDGSERPTPNEEASGEGQQSTTADTIALEAEQATDQAASNAAPNAAGQTLSAEAAAPQEDLDEPATLRGRGSEIVQILEIVLGIAAGLSVLTLIVTLYQRHSAR